MRTLFLVLIGSIAVSSIGFAADEYDPTNPDAFILEEKEPNLQQYGYKNLCPSQEFCFSNLPYEKYHGMRGHFTGDPIPIRFGGKMNYVAHPLVLENGESYYYIYNPKYGLFGVLSDLVDLRQSKSRNEMVGKPLVPNSPLMVEKYDETSGHIVVTGGKHFDAKAVGVLKEILEYALPANHVAVANMLDRSGKIGAAHDEIEGGITLRIPSLSKGYSIEPEIELKNGRRNLYIILRLRGSDWVFADNFILAADQVRYQSPELKFSRDVGRTAKIYESAIVNVSDELRRVLNAVATSQKATIRFKGKSMQDEVISEEEKDNLKLMLRLNDLLK